MKSLFSRARAKRWLLLVAVLLPLHAGLAQAAMVMAPHADAANTAQHEQAGEPAAMADSMPCHGEAAPAAPDPKPHEKGCCDLGSCHCVAACGLPFATVRVIAQRLLFEPPVAFLSVPATAQPPDLRPPIG